MTEDTDWVLDVGRRRWLQIVSGGVIAGTAGCLGGDDGDGGDGTDEPTDTATTVDDSEPTPTATPASGGSLIVANESNLTGLDPHKTASVVSWNVVYNVAETLVTFEDGAVTGRLASDWEIGSEGLDYTFTLKEGVQFHPPVSRELTADDVVYSFERMQSEQAQMASDLSPVQSIEATGDYEVTFTLAEPFAPFMNFLPRVPWVIVPEEAVQDQGGSIGDFQEPVGTGPFVFDEHVEGDHTTLVAFDDYHEEGVPHVDEVRFTPVPDDDSRVLALRNGDVDFARQIPGKDVETLQNDDNVRTIINPGAAWGQVHINCNMPPWDNPAVRRAVAHVIDRQAIVDAGLFGVGNPAWQPYPKGNFWHHENLKNARKRDPDRARQILEDAGNPLESEGITLSVKTTTAYQTMQSTAEILVANLNEAGIDAEIDQMEWGAMLNDFLNANFGAMAFSVPFKADPQRHYFNFLHPESPQYNKYTEDQPDAARMYELLEMGRVETDPDERKSIYRELQELVNKNVPWISTVHRSNVLAMRADVSGNPSWTLPYNRFWKLSKR